MISVTKTKNGSSNETSFVVDYIIRTYLVSVLFLAHSLCGLE